MTTKRGRPPKVRTVTLDEVEPIVGEVVHEEQTDTAIVRYDPTGATLDVRNNIGDVIAALPDMEPAQLVGLFRSTMTVESAAFVLRGACASEILNRVENSMADSTDAQVSALLIDLTRQTGVTTATLREDKRIFDTFSDHLLDSVLNQPERLLPREMYRSALKVEQTTWVTPHQLVDFFEEMRDTGMVFTAKHAAISAKEVVEGADIEDLKKIDADRRKVAINSPVAELPPARIPTTSLKISATPQNKARVEAILSIYDTFEDWFLGASDRWMADRAAADMAREEVDDGAV